MTSIENQTERAEYTNYTVQCTACGEQESFTGNHI